MLVARRAAEDGDGLSLVQEAVTGRAVADAPAEELVLSLIAFRGQYTGRQQQRLRLIDLVVREDHQIIIHRHHVRDLLVGALKPHLAGVLKKALIQLIAGDQSEPRIIRDFLALSHLVAVSGRAEPDKVLFVQFQIDRGGKPRRPRPDDHGIIHHNSFLAFRPLMTGLSGLYYSTTSIRPSTCASRPSFVAKNSSMMLLTEVATTRGRMFAFTSSRGTPMNSSKFV